MPISNYPHGFANGVTLREIPTDIRLNGEANVFWVDSVHGSNGNKGTYIQPFATIDYAVGRCTANNGDIIYVAAGHTETVIAASGLDLDVAGITVVFMGEGADRATINFTTAVTASVTIAAANVTLINPRFTAGIDALTGPISITAADCTIKNGIYFDGTSIDTTDCIVATSAAPRLQIRGWKYIPGDEAGTQKQSNIQLDGVDNAILTDIDITGDFATGNIENVTDEILNVRLENIRLKNTNSGPQPGMVLDANATGQAKNIDIRIASGTTYVSSVAKLNWDIQCLGYAADGTGGDPIGTAGGGTIEQKIDAIKAEVDKIDSATMATAPAAGSVASFIASGGTALGTQLADSKSLVDAMGSDGATLSYGTGSILGAIGTSFIIKKTLTSSNITQAGVDITGVSSNGELEIEQIICKTDGTGLATGTNFQIYSDNAKGLANIFVETVANLGASKTIDLETASITKQRTVLETGKKLIANSTVADCTGTGTIDIYIKFKRIAAGAIIAAA